VYTAFLGLVLSLGENSSQGVVLVNTKENVEKIVDI